jgi:arginyl-tRNA synthetase|tara:strand:- start:6634 stop:8400 length:1767 start_codon:yes stop_codon:yes gene_type:complete
MEQLIGQHVIDAIVKLYGIENVEIQLQKTRKEFQGDITLVVFPFLKASKKGPEQTANEIGEYLLKSCDSISAYNSVKGFLNLTIVDSFWMSQFTSAFNNDHFGIIGDTKDAETIVVEFCSPNTNKPLHLGHIRNNLLGYSVSKIIEASGKKVKKVQVINDRGIHICKSMIAWSLFADNQTPESTNTKGDHFVGNYYIMFDKVYKEQIQELIDNGSSKEDAEKNAPILLQAQEMLLKWEAKDSEVITLWEKMNKWVYQGFESTNKRLGIEFDKNYFESETYLLGKKNVFEGLEKGDFYQKEDGSIWIDLTNEGLDEKILLRSDGTAVYMTQDIGTAINRHEDFDFSNMVYTVGNEQDYHFKVLFLILQKLGYKWADNCFHLSYGMVDLPSGKMKSREGTVVDADDLMQEMYLNAKTISQELGKLEGMEEKDAEALYENIGLGALKYFMLKVDPKKRMLFDPKESIDFNGNTAPFIQYTHARIQSIVRKYDKPASVEDGIEMIEKERDLIKVLMEYPQVIQDSASNYSPALLANYIYDLVKEFNGYYQNVPILVADSEKTIAFRVAISQKVANVIKSGMNLLGISVPDKM